MPLQWGLQQIVDNINLSIEWVLTLVGLLGGMIFAAKDFKIGLITILGTMAGLFIWFYQAHWNYNIPLNIFFMTLIVMALSLFAVHDTSRTGGFS